MTDPSLNLDTILKLIEIVSVIGGGGVVAFRLGRVTTQFEAGMSQQAKEIAELKGDVKAVNKLITDMALQSQRMDALDKRLDELAHGRGFIDVAVKRPVRAAK
jgi:hypothetical protein